MIVGRIRDDVRRRTECDRQPFATPPGPVVVAGRTTVRAVIEVATPTIPPITAVAAMPIATLTPVTPMILPSPVTAIPTAAPVSMVASITAVVLAAPPVVVAFVRRVRKYQGTDQPGQQYHRHDRALHLNLPSRGPEPHAQDRASYLSAS